MSARTSIHSSIEAAMGSLDLTLESELTLFRNRYFDAVETPDPSPPVTAQSQQSAQPPVFFANANADVPFEHHEDDTILEAPEHPVVGSDDLATEAARLLNVSFEDIDAEDSKGREPQASFEALQGSQMSEADIPTGAIIPSKALLPVDDALADSATLDTYTDPALDDYLASSEALLKHLDTPTPRDQMEPSVSLKWFAWAAGATLALSLLAAFFLQNVFRTPEPSLNPANPENPEISLEDPTPPPNSQASGVNSPDLASKEFQEVKPGSLAELPTPEAQPDADSPSDSTPTGTSPAAAQSDRESDVTSTGKPPQRQYYVVTDYTDEASLDNARKVVPEAKLVNFTGGTKIQLQQLSDESTARTAAAEYEQKGLSVEILATATE